MGSREGQVQDLVRKYARLANLEDVTPHVLRHIFCTEALKVSDLVKVAALAGHQTLNTTARYTQPTARDLEEAVEKLVD